MKYAKTDRLPAVVRPDTLEVLHDRARGLLSEADIPMVQSTDKTKMVGRPRLVFTVTLNNETAAAPAIRVDSKLYDRVRLSRDPSKELELATWVTSGTGYSNVTNQLLMDVFEKQVNEFVKQYREANPNRAAAVKSTPAVPAKTEKVNTLQA